MYDVTELEIRNHGALCVLQEGAEYLPQITEDLANTDDVPMQGEPGDYYSDSTVSVDYILTGPAMMRFLKRFGCSWGDKITEMRQLLLKLMMSESAGPLNIKRDPNETIEYVNSLNWEQLRIAIRERQRGKQGRVKKAFVVKTVAALKYYLEMTDAEKGRDLLINYPNEFADFLEEEHDHPDYENLASKVRKNPDDVESLEDIDDALTAEFYNWARNRIDDVYAPSYLFMESHGIIKDQWLIHFTSDANAIARNGFQFGVADLATLGLTTSFKNDSSIKRDGGYNFAYLLEDFEKYGRSRGGRGWKYGSECVIFKASGLLVWHHGDEEYQVVFDGKTAHDIIPIVEGDDGWEITDWRRHDRPVFKAEELPRVIDWVVNNFEQYRSNIVKTPGKQVTNKNASPPALDTQKSVSYYHGIRSANEATAKSIMKEGLQNIPSEFWGVNLRPQEAVYLTKHLGTAIAYAGGITEIASFPAFIRECLFAGHDKIYVAVIDGKDLTANVEVDEDELDDLLSNLHLQREEDFSENEKKLMDLWRQHEFARAKKLIPHLPPQLTYWLLDATQFQNLAHHGPVPVQSVYVWDLKDPEALSNLRKSYDYNEPVGAQRLHAE
jgi:hypothetical protein